jgi:hypothetical protein
MRQQEIYRIALCFSEDHLGRALLEAMLKIKAYEDDGETESADDWRKIADMIELIQLREISGLYKLN